MHSASIPSSSTVICRAAITWLAVRRARLPAVVTGYEDGNGFSEGPAMFLEMQLARCLAGHEAPPELRWAQGFRGFADPSALREQRIERMVRSLRGESNVDDDP